jgi:hypothetical protein
MGVAPPALIGRRPFSVSLPRLRQARERRGQLPLAREKEHVKKLIEKQVKV